MSWTRFKATVSVAISCFMFLTMLSLNGETKPRSRYFYNGDGRITIINGKNGVKFMGKYRGYDGMYDEKAIRSIYRVFGAKHGDPLAEISMRLIEFLDYLEDQLNPGASITIISGWRSPEYNTKLRQQGQLAATASLHQYGMAVDFKLSGVSSKWIWEYVQSIGFGGTGYYNGDYVHVDVGPARFWDQETSGVGTDISDYNKLIMLMTDQDIYYPGETVTMRFVRMTAFPIGVSTEFSLEKVSRYEKLKNAVPFHPKFRTQVEGKCPQFQNIGQMLGITWELPHDLSPGRYKIRANFCNKNWQDMPDHIVTPEFDVYPR